MASQQRLFLGIFGDAASTRALVADETGYVHGTGASGPATGERWSQSVRESAGAALDMAAHSETDLSVVAAAVPSSGASHPAALSGLFRDAPIIAADPLLAEIAGAGAGSEGVLLKAYDEVLAYGRTSRGAEARAGGWGTLISGEGSAEWIGLEGLRAAFRTLDGRAPHSLLADLLPERFGAEDLSGVHALLSGGISPVAMVALATDVAAAAAHGDNAARNILNHAALHLANAAAAVYRGLWEPGKDVAVYPSGPVFKDAFLVEQLDGWLAKLAPGLTRQNPIAPPEAGALLIACGAAGITPDDLDWDTLLHGLSAADTTE